MIDTITIIINNYDYQKINSLIDSFSNVRNNVGIKSGRHKNFLFFLTESSFKATGSIVKLIKGTNQNNYDVSIVNESINYLSNLLGLDVSDAKVTRIDFGVNVKLKYPINNYVSMFVQPPCSKKYTVEKKGFETIEYRKWDRSIMFYDKVAESKTHNVKLHDGNGNCNILRFEVKLFRNLPSRFNVPKVTYKMLEEASIYNRLLSTWHDEYTKILKIFRPVISLDCSLPKNFKHTLCAYGINAIGGVENVLKYINNEPKAEKYKYRLITMVKETGANFTVVDGEALIEELNEKIYLFAHPAA